MKSQIESLLFISAKPLSVDNIAKILNIAPENVLAELDSLMQEYNLANRGICISKVVHSETIKYQMVSNPTNVEFVKKFLKLEFNGDLTRPSLETLSIIAYLGPITKPELEKVRGVNCSLILRNLMIRGLVEEEKDDTKSEFTYMVTSDFLNFLGVFSIDQIPDYNNLRNDPNLVNILKEKQENN